MENLDSKGKELHQSPLNFRDILYVGMLVALAFFLCRGFLVSEYVWTGYEDWIHHAYRIESLRHYGFSTWTHDWACGFPLWQSYQFIPHVTGAFVADVLGSSAARAECLITGILFIIFPLLIYLFCRINRFSSEASLLPGLLSLDMMALYCALDDYSLFIAVVLFPLLLLGCSKIANPKYWYLMSLLIGLSVYIHPFLVLIGALSLVIAILLRWHNSLFTLINCIVIIIFASAFYWVPMLFGDKPKYTDPWYFSTSFLRSIFPHFLLGLSGCLFAVAALLLLRQTKIKRINRRLFNFLVILGVALLILIITTYIGKAPSIILMTQATRWVAFLGILVAILAAFLVEAYRSHKLFKLIYPIAICAVIAEGVWIASSFSPSTSNEWDNPEWNYPVAIWASDHANEISYQDRIWVDEVAYSSYFGFGNFRVSGSYASTYEYNILSHALNWMIQSNAEFGPLAQNNFSLIESYLKALGVSYVFTLHGSPITEALLPGGKFADKLIVVDCIPEFFVFKVPWEPVQAFITPVYNREDMFFPDIKYNTDDQKLMRDELVSIFTEIMYSEETSEVQLSWPSQTEIEAYITQVPPDSYLIVSESYDGSWICTVNNEKVKVERNGPNYIGIDLSQFSGDLQVHLEHGTHWTWTVGIAISAISLLLTVITFTLEVRRQGTIIKTE